MTMTPAPTTAPARSRRRAWLRDLAFLLAILAGMHWVQTRHVPTGQAPAFQAPLADGGEVTLSSWRAQHAGKPVMIYFWADWCGVCRAQRGAVEAVMADWPVLTVAMSSGNAAQVRHYLRNANLDWPTAIDPDGALAARFGLRGVPAMVVVGPTGGIRAVSVGYTPSWSLRARLWWATLLG